MPAPPPIPGPGGRAFVGFLGDGISLTDPTLATQAVFDGKDGYYKVSFFNNSPNVSIIGPTYTASITQGQNVLTLSGANPGWYPQPEDIGKKIAVAGAGAAGAVLLSTILDLDSSNTPEESKIVLADNAQTGLSAAAGTIVIWPYFEAADVGKTIWISQGGASNWTGATSSPNGWGCNGPLLGTIASVTDYKTFALNANPTTACNGFAARMVWGTDNTTAIIAARNLAAQRGLRRYHYENGASVPALCCAFNMLGSQGAYDALSNGHHWGNNVSSFWTDASGNILRYGIVPHYAWMRSAPPPTPRLNAKWHLRCSTAASTVTYLAWGDSMALDSPLQQSPSWSQMTRVFQRIRASNVAVKTLNEGINYAIGGAIWQWFLGNPYAGGNIAWPTAPGWYIANTANTWDQFVNASLPTIVDLLENGGNDRQYAYQPAIQAVIQKIRNGFAKTNGYAPDIIMCNMRPWPITSPNALPNFADQDGEEQTAMLHASMARVQDIGFLNYYDVASLSFFGWSPFRLKPRMRPAFAAGSSVAAGLPIGMGERCRDYDLRWGLGSAQAGAAVWGAAPFLVRLGAHPQNNLRLGLDSTSTYLTMRAHTWGCTAGEFGNPAPTITIANNSGALTVGAATSATVSTISAVALDPVTNGTLITTTGFTWPTNCVGQMLLIPNAQYHWSGAPAGTSDFVTQIIGRPSANQILVADALPVPGVSSAGWGLGWSYAPIIFSKAMADANADVILSDGATTLVTTIASYTSSTQVTLSAVWPGTSRSAFSTGTSMFLGRISIPTITCNGSNGTNLIAAGTALATGPTLQVAVRGDDLEVSYFPYFNSYAPTATVTIGSGSPNLSSTTTIFEAGMVGQAIQVPGAGAAGATLQSYIKTFTSGTAVVLSENAGTALSGVSKTITIANAITVSGGGGQPYPSMVYRGPVERRGGQFYPVIIPSSTLTIGHVNLRCYFGVPEYYAPAMLEYEAWGTSDQDYAYGGAGGTHDNAWQSLVVDEQVLNTTDWIVALTNPPLAARTAITANDTTGTAVSIPAGAVLRAIYVANTTANAVTGGINIGTTAAGSDVVSALAVGANALVSVFGGQAALLKTYFSATAPQQLFISTASAWNSASLNVRFEFDAQPS